MAPRSRAAARLLITILLASSTASAAALPAQDGDVVDVYLAARQEEGLPINFVPVSGPEEEPESFIDQLKDTLLSFLNGFTALLSAAESEEDGPTTTTVLNLTPVEGTSSLATSTIVLATSTEAAESSSEPIFQILPTNDPTDIGTTSPVSTSVVGPDVDILPYPYPVTPDLSTGVTAEPTEEPIFSILPYPPLPIPSVIEEEPDNITYVLPSPTSTDVQSELPWEEYSLYPFPSLPVPTGYEDEPESMTEAAITPTPEREQVLPQSTSGIVLTLYSNDSTLPIIHILPLPGIIVATTGTSDVVVGPTSIPAPSTPTPPYTNTSGFNLETVRETSTTTEFRTVTAVPVRSSSWTYFSNSTSPFSTPLSGLPTAISGSSVIGLPTAIYSSSVIGTVASSWPSLNTTAAASNTSIEATSTFSSIPEIPTLPPLPPPNSTVLSPPTPSNTTTTPPLSPLHPLRTLCRPSPRNIHTLGLPLLSTFYGPNAYPALHPFPGCRPPALNSSQALRAPGLLNCTELGQEVQACQNLGIKILLMVRGSTLEEAAGNAEYGNPAFDNDPDGPWGPYFGLGPAGAGPNEGRVTPRVPNLFDSYHPPSALALTLHSLFGESHTERADLRPLGPLTPGNAAVDEEGIRWWSKPLGEEVVVDGFEVQVPREWEGHWQEGQFDEFVGRLRELSEESWVEGGGVKGGEGDLGVDGPGIVVKGWV